MLNQIFGITFMGLVALGCSGDASDQVAPLDEHVEALTPAAAQATTSSNEQLGIAAATSAVAVASKRSPNVCLSHCRPDDQLCIDCCICLAEGGKPRECCF